MSEFFGKVKDSLDKGVTTVSVRSKELLEGARLKGQIGSLADQKKSRLEELGSLVYAMHLEGRLGPAAEITEKCSDLAGIDEEIQKKEEELRLVHIEANKALGVPVCSECGQALGEDDRFCRNCGLKAEAPAASEPEETAQTAAADEKAGQEEPGGN